MSGLYKTIWVVDDEEDIIYCFMTTFASHKDYRFVYVPTARHVKAQPGDIVFLDLNGTKAESLEVVEGVTVFRMTGGVSKADLHKPFNRKDIEKLIASVKSTLARVA
jgi:hypothetical protein